MMTIKILIVDDDDIVIFLHSLVIKESGLSADPVSFLNGVPALAYLNENAAQHDRILIFLDINMPVMNGWELLDELGKTSYHSRVSVIVVTSSIDEEDREKAALYSQVIDYIEKPLSIDTCIGIKKRLTGKPSSEAAGC